MLPKQKGAEIVHGYQFDLLDIIHKHAEDRTNETSHPQEWQWSRDSQYKTTQKSQK